MATPTIHWLKLDVNIFQNPKIVLLRAMPDGDTIVLIWIQLLAFCGQQNNSGILRISDSIPITVPMLATVLGCNQDILQRAMDSFAQLHMVELDGDTYTIPGWSEHQDLSKYEAIKASDRERKRRERERKRNGASIPTDVTGQSQDSHGTVTGTSADVTAPEEEEEEDKDKEVDIREPSGPPSERVDYQHIVDLYNRGCPSLPRCTRLSDARRKAIKARLNGGYTMGDFEALFRAAGSSSFLAGRNDRNWTASFDWLVKDANMAKVLDGAYQDRGNNGKPSGPNYDYTDTTGSF